MSNPYVGEIRMAGFNFAPVGWAFCNGQTLSIAEYEALFTLIGTTYGGDGATNFQLPNLQGRIPFHQGTLNGNTMVIGQLSGSENVTLTSTQIPSHTHLLMANSASGGQPSPSGGVWAMSELGEFSTEAPAAAHAMASSAILPSGGSQPHDNMPPFLVVNFIISLYGIFPSQN
jgi:microcystin-dependent protein